MKNVDHTHPDTDRPFGEQVVFARGPTVAADGGERSQGDRERHRAAPDGSERSEASRTSKDGTSFGSGRGAANESDMVESEADAETEEQMRDVDHEPPNEAEANRVFERGREGRDDTR